MKIDAGISRRRARVEMIPLIDCVFILLVFFIYSMLTMTVQRGMVVQLPAATTVEANQDEAVVVTVSPDGVIQLDDAVVGIDDLRTAVLAAQRQAPGRGFVINADRRAEHGTVVRILDELKAVGVTRVVILSEEREGT